MNTDILKLILRDHKPLKRLIRTMKSEDATLTQKKAAFKEFAPTLIAHAKPEAQTWYKEMKDDKELKVEGLEGDIEHKLAEHHIKEEEEEMLPSLRKKFLEKK